MTVVTPRPLSSAHRASARVAGWLAATAALAGWPGPAVAQAPPEAGGSIIGGTPSTDDPAVVAVTLAGGACTGALVAPGVVLTAAHCALPAVGAAEPGSVAVGEQRAAPTETAAVVAVLPQRLYRGQGQGADLALLRLDAPLSPAPLPWAAAAAVPAQVRVVGFGLAAFGQPDSAGLRREVTLAVRGVDGEYLRVGDASANTCQGDSGGPAFADGGAGGEAIVALTSYGEVGCAGDAWLGTLAPHAAWLEEVLAAWDGPCAADGACGDAPCAPWPDPDCDPCGLEGTCAAGCPRVDLDCPLGGVAGEPCEADADCESRRCAPAPEDPRWSFCSATCDPARAGADCPAPLDACAAGSCGFAEGTPGVLGAACEDAADCRSGLCDAAAGACAEPCGAGGACPAGYACEPVGAGLACTTPGGCCSSSGGGGSPAAALALLPALRRRRRRANPRA